VYRLAIVAIEYPDVKHNARVSPSDWEKALFSTGAYNTTSVTGQKVFGSMNDFYLEQSCGKFRVQGKMFDWVQVRRKRGEYANDTDRYTLLREALDRLLERDGKKALEGYDGIFFVYAGDRFQTRRGGLYWPHRATVAHGGRRWSYFICPEGGRNMASISVITHEFGHMLGLPDLYARPEVPGQEGVGVWCTMSVGHGRDGRPLHFSAWCKERLGWLTPAVLDPRVKQKLLLAPIEGSSRECYKVLIRPDGSEYLLLENRTRKGFDQNLPAQGLLIWRVIDGRPVLEESHGIAGPQGPNLFLGSIPYPSGSNNAFTPHTTPSSKSLKGGGLPVHITNIRRLPDGRIAFHIGYEYL
jgi:M6 family metalloprotease-like protein